MGDYTPTFNPLGLTGPDGADPLRNGDNRLRALIDALSGNIELVDTLPGSPRDGQIIYYQDATLAAIGRVWVFRYNAASGSSYKWEFIGGAPLTAASATQESLSSNTYQAGTTSALSITMPGLAGDYIVHLDARMSPPEDGEAWTSYTVGATAASDTWGVNVSGFVSGAVDGIVAGGSTTYSHTIAAGATIAARYRRGASGVGYNTNWRALTITPIRVG